LLTDSCDLNRIETEKNCEKRHIYLFYKTIQMDNDMTQPVYAVVPATHGYCNICPCRQRRCSADTDSGSLEGTADQGVLHTGLTDRTDNGNLKQRNANQGEGSHFDIKTPTILI